MRLSPPAVSRTVRPIMGSMLSSNPSTAGPAGSATTPAAVSMPPGAPGAQAGVRPGAPVHIDRAPGPISEPVRLPGALDARAVAVMTLLCFTWALQQISLKAVSDQISPMLMVALRSLVAAVLLAGLMAWRGERLVRHRFGAGAAVGTLFAVEFLLVAEALRLTAAAHVVVFLYTAPLFAVLGLHLLRPEERLVRGQWIGVALAFGGTALAFLGGHGTGPSAGPSANGSLLGDALALLAGAAWGATTVTIRSTSLSQAPASETLLYQLLGAVVWLLPAVWITGQAHFEPTLMVWAHLGFHSVVVSFASFLTWFWLMRKYLASRLGVFSFLTPLLGVLLGAWLLKESLTPSFLAGSGLALAGIVLASRAAKATR